MTGRKTPMPLQSPCQYTKYCLRAFHCPNAFLLRQNCCAPDSDGFLCDFWFLRRRRADARQGEKDKKHPAHSMQSPAKWVCMEKEEGDCLVQLLPQGGSGTAQASSDVVRRVCSCQLMVSTSKPYKYIFHKKRPYHLPITYLLCRHYISTALLFCQALSQKISAALTAL